MDPRGDVAIREELPSAEEYQRLRALVGWTMPEPSAVAPSLRGAGVAVTTYDRITANPDIESVEAAAQAYRDSQADLILGIGGGSALDTAKVARLLAPGGRIAEYACEADGVGCGSRARRIAVLAYRRLSRRGAALRG